MLKPSPAVKVGTKTHAACLNGLRNPVQNENMSYTKNFAALLICSLIAGPSAAKEQSPLGPADLSADNAHESGTPALTNSDVGAWMDGYFPAVLEQGKIAGAQVIVVMDGEVLFMRGYGFADPRDLATSFAMAFRDRWRFDGPRFSTFG